MTDDPFAPRWPARLWIVRHGQSAGNVALEAARAAGLARIGVETRDVDVPLSEAGRAQAAATGARFAALPENERPHVVLCSPYLRALDTAQAIRAAGGVPGDAAFRIDERLREREFGILDGLTTAGVREHYPEEALRRATLGKFYHRPPGGESWADVILRLRSSLNSVALHCAGKRVMIVCHQVVVLCLRYILEEMDEAAVLAIDAAGDVANCSVTEYRFSGGKPLCALYNDASHVVASPAPVTAAPDASSAMR